VLASHSGFPGSCQELGLLIWLLMVKIVNRFVSTFLLLGQLPCNMCAAGPCLSATFRCPVRGSWSVQVKHQWPYMQQLIFFQSFMIISCLIHIPALLVCFLQFSCIRGLDNREAFRTLGVPPSSLWTGAAPFQRNLLPIQNSGSTYCPACRTQGIIPWNDWSWRLRISRISTRCSSLVLWTGAALF
jgi:hypothetical protein